MLKRMKEIKPKEKEFAQRYITNGNNATQAAKDTYQITNDNYARLKGHRKVKSKNVQKAIKSIADSIPDSLLIEKHLELLNSRETIVSDGEVIDDKIDVHGVSKGLDMAYKIKGAYAPEKSINTIVGLEELENQIKDATKLFRPHT